MNTSESEKAEVDALIAQLSSSNDDNKKSSINVSSSPENNSTLSERKRIYIRQNSGSNSNAQYAASPTDTQKKLLTKNTRIYKKNDRKSRQGLFKKKEKLHKIVFFFLFKEEVVV